MAKQADVRPGPASLNPGDILLDGSVIAQGFAKGAQGCEGAPREEDAGGIPIQTVHRGGMKGCAGLLCRQTRGDAVVMPAAGLGGQPGGLVEHEHVGLAGKDRRQRKGCGCGAGCRHGQLPAEGRQTDDVAFLNNGKGFDPAPVYTDLTGSDPFMQLPLRDIKASLEPLEQLLAAFGPGDGNAGEGVVHGGDGCARSAARRLRGEDCPGGHGRC